MSITYENSMNIIREVTDLTTNGEAIIVYSRKAVIYVDGFFRKYIINNTATFKIPVGHKITIRPILETWIVKGVSATSHQKPTIRRYYARINGRDPSLVQIMNNQDAVGFDPYEYVRLHRVLFDNRKLAGRTTQAAALVAGAPARTNIPAAITVPTVDEMIFIIFKMNWLTAIGDFAGSIYLKIWELAAGGADTEHTIWYVNDHGVALPGTDYCTLILALEYTKAIRSIEWAVSGATPATNMEIIVTPIDTLCLSSIVDGADFITKEKDMSLWPEKQITQKKEPNEPVKIPPKLIQPWK